MLKHTVRFKTTRGQIAFIIMGYGRVRHFAHYTRQNALCFDVIQVHNITRGSNQYLQLALEIHLEIKLNLCSQKGVLLSRAYAGTNTKLSTILLSHLIPQ